MEEFKQKVENIAKKYATLTEKRLDVALESETLSDEIILGITDGIRMLNHVANTLERIARLQHSDRHR